VRTAFSASARVGFRRNILAIPYTPADLLLGMREQLCTVNMIRPV